MRREGEENILATKPPLHPNSALLEVLKRQPPAVATYCHSDKIHRLLQFWRGSIISYICYIYDVVAGCNENDRETTFHDHSCTLHRQCRR